jgi:hypothetical protein
LPGSFPNHSFQLGTRSDPRFHGHRLRRLRLSILAHQSRPDDDQGGVEGEIKNTEGDPHIKARQRRRRTTKTQRQMLQEVPKADVILTNPTHLAIALRYDRKNHESLRKSSPKARV